MADALLLAFIVVGVVAVLVLEWRMWSHIRAVRRERIEAGDPGPLDRLPRGARVLVIVSIVLVGLLFVQLEALTR